MTNTIRIKMNEYMTTEFDIPNELTLVEFQKIASLMEKHYVAGESNVQSTTSHMKNRKIKGGYKQVRWKPEWKAIIKEFGWQYSLQHYMDMFNDPHMTKQRIKCMIHKLFGNHKSVTL